MSRLFYFPKLVLAYLWYLITFPMWKKSVFLFSEKPDEARDNGFYFFQYVQKQSNDFSDSSFYLIRKHSSDFDKLSKYSNKVVFWNSFKHFYLYFRSSKLISSQWFPYPISKKIVRFFPCHHKRLYWLQHGVTKDKMSSLDYSLNKNIAFISCASSKEQKIFTEELHYPETIAVATGFCRFDGLVDESSFHRPTILVMPTFRKWLESKNVFKPSKDEESVFLSSKYFSFYSELLTDPSLISFLKSKGVSLIFYPHYALQPYLHLFKVDSECVVLANKENYDVQALLKQCNLMVTDYSSVAFDFAYMQKPVLYAHFDLDDYRQNHYPEGSFSYVNDGFGEVSYSLKEIVDLICEYINSSFKMQNIYKERSLSFFDVPKENNCSRVFSEVFEHK